MIQATVRHGTYRRASGLMCAAATAAHGSSSSGTMPAPSRFVTPPTTSTAARPQAATNTEATTDVLPRQTATGP